MQKNYPPLTIRKLLETDLISSQTKLILYDRLKQLKEIYEPEFFNSYLFCLLQAVSDRLIPQIKNREYIDLAASIDRRLAEGKNDGWRYASMPPDGQLYQSGLYGIDEMAAILFNKNFIKLEEQYQNDILLNVQQQNIEGLSWNTISPGYFFEELLAELTEAYYSHPLAQEEIGYVGMADVNGWNAIGLDEKEMYEPDEEFS